MVGGLGFFAQPQLIYFETLALTLIYSEDDHSINPKTYKIKIAQTA